MQRRTRVGETMKVVALELFRSVWFIYGTWKAFLKIPSSFLFSPFFMTQRAIKCLGYTDDTCCYVNGNFCYSLRVNEQKSISLCLHRFEWDVLWGWKGSRLRKSCDAVLTLKIRFMPASEDSLKGKNRIRRFRDFFNSRRETWNLRIF